MNAKRRSFGGTVVEASLAALGYDLESSSVALVETTRPRLRRHETVLVQNAWNFLDRRDFRRLAAPYPASMRRRMLARRQLSTAVVTRASRVVCLTEAMADLVGKRHDCEIVVSPVTLPLDFIQATQKATVDGSVYSDDLVLIPGSITWYKRPSAAVDWILANLGRSTELHLLFAGRDDGSGAAREVSTSAARAGLRAEIRSLERHEMVVAMQRARVVVLPSELESLGLSLGEALAMSRRVVASPIAPHREVASRIGVEPEWIGATKAQRECGPPATITAGEIVEQWNSLGNVLGLEKPPAARNVA